MSPKPNQPEVDPSELSPEPFIELMALERIGVSHDNSSGNISDGNEKVEHFRSLAAPFPPAEGTMVFGGHVYAQSAWAACQTVEKGFVVHVSRGSPSHKADLPAPYQANSILTHAIGHEWDLDFGWSARHPLCIYSATYPRWETILHPRDRSPPRRESVFLRRVLFQAS